MLSSGKVAHFPGCEYLGGGEFVSRVSGVILADTAAAEILRGAIGGVLGRLQRLPLAPGRAERVQRFLRSGRSVVCGK